jgi:ferrochelatase
LFRDPYIIQLPLGGLYQDWLARKISRKRAPRMIPIYRSMGGSPLLPQTRQQALALSRRVGLPVFVAMRYTPPRATDAIAECVAKGIRRAIALPLYPQFSRTTTETSLVELADEAKKAGITLTSVREYPTHPQWIEALMRQWNAAVAPHLIHGDKTHVILAAHGIPQVYVRRGDPYIAQIEATAGALRERLPKDLPITIAYQSRVGPVKWTQPYLDHEIERLGGEGVKTLVVFPIAFVTEHQETLYELDVDMKRIATEAGVARFIRVPTVKDDPVFIEALADLTRGALRSPWGGEASRG